MAVTEVLERLKTLPSDPGVYLLRGARGEVLYVGKAKSLRNRVRCYFQPAGEVRPLARYLDSLTRDIEVVVTDTEKEAILLENTLIKRHKPRFNIRLKDDKTFLSLRLDSNEEFPRIHWVRKWRRDGALYFGPYSGAGAIRETYRMLQRTFGLRACSDAVFKNRSRPCLLHQLQLCSAPCVGLIARDEYRASIEDAVRFLKGGKEETQAVVDRLREQMREASVKLEFERAAALRDRIGAIERSLDRQKVQTDRSSDRDVFGLHREGDLVGVTVLHFRDGALVSSRGESFRSELLDGEILAAFLEQFYGAERYVPEEILLPAEPDDRELLEEWLKERRGAATSIGTPRRGEKEDLVRMACRNAEVAIEASEARSARSDAVAGSLQSKLRLRQAPRRVHAFDVSNLHGDEAVGSRVAFDSGEPNRDHYRRFRVRRAEVPDDVASIREIVERSLRRDRESGEALPDLVIVDGGAGQVAAARAAAAAVGIPDLDVIGIAKGRGLRRRTKSRPGAEDRVVLSAGDEVRLAQGSAELLLLQRVRDEAHRTAIRFHRLRRSAARLRSPIEEIEGLGPKRRRSLLRRFGGIEGLKTASLDQLLCAPGVPEPVARRLYDLLHPLRDDQARG